LARYCLLNALRRISAAFLAVPFNTPARDAIRDPTIAAIGDPRALPELLVHAIRHATTASPAPLSKVTRPK
jgi:hypothetical protein